MNHPLERILYLNNPFLHAADFYLIVNDSIVSPPILTGLSRPVRSKAYSDPAYPVLISLPANSTVDVYVKVADPFSTTDCPMFLLSIEKAKSLNIWRFQIGFLWLGIVLLSLLLSSFLFFYTKQKIFAYYVLLGLGSAIAISSNIGLVLLFINADPYQLLNNYYELGGALLINFMPRFLNCIVPIATLNKTLWKFIKGIGLPSLHHFHTHLHSLISNSPMHFQSSQLTSWSFHRDWFSLSTHHPRSSCLSRICPEQGNSSWYTLYISG